MEPIIIKGKIEFLDKEKEEYSREFSATLQDSVALTPFEAHLWETAEPLTLLHRQKCLPVLLLNQEPSVRTRRQATTF